MSHKYLDYIRELNKAKASKCHICKKQSTKINAYGYQIKFVCDDHFEAGIDVILDTSIPNVIHRTYPNGRSIPENMMNPNIGGFKPKESKTDIWATQISFEE